MRSPSGLQASTVVRLLSLLAVGLLVVAGPPPNAQSTGGTPVSFGSDLKISGVPSDPSGTLHVETFAAANPKDPKNAVAVYMDLYPTVMNTRPCSFSTTGNGGQSWTVQGDAPLRTIPGLNACSDPSIGADDRGTFYMAYLDDNYQPATGVDDTDIRVARSNDKGKSFRASSIAVNSGPADYLDKPLLAVDGWAGSPSHGNVYVAYADFTLQDQVFVVTSRDGGNSWSAPILLDGPGGQASLLIGSMPTVAPDGTVYIFWSRFPYYVPPMTIRFSKSTDGGATWSGAADVAAGLPTPTDFYLKNADPEFGSTANHGIIGNSFPMGAVASDGKVYVTWTDFPNGTCRKSQSTGPIQPCTNSDVRLTVSRDGGATWSAPVKISDETGSSDQFYPTLAAHSNGLVSIAWLDKRLDPANINYDVFYTNTYDGATFLPNVRVTTASSITGLRQFLGDYNGMAATGNAVFPVWGDLRDNLSVQTYTARGTFTP